MQGALLHLIVGGAVLMRRYRAVAKRSGGEKNGGVFASPRQQTLRGTGRAQGRV